MPPGHRHTNSIYQLTKLIQNYSTNLYENIRYILYLPVESSLYEYFSEEINFYKDCIQNIDLIHNIIKNYKEIY